MTDRKLMTYKNCIAKFFSMLLMLPIVAHAIVPEARAIDYIDYATFIQLPLEEQRSLIKINQRLLANMEEMQVQDYKRKTSYLPVQHFLNNMLENAYANNDRKIGEKNQRICIYGGWISYAKEDGFCRHPALKIESTDKNAYTADTRTYLSSNQKIYVQMMNKHCAPHNKNSMVCNPKTFGAKLDGTPFCSSGDGNSYNSSYGCLRAINDYAKQKNKENPEQIHNQIIDNIIKNELQNNPEQKGIDSLANILMLNYDTCMCKGREGYSNTKYSERMYDQRTCYAWLYQTKQILSRIKDSPAACNMLGNISYQKSEAGQAESLASLYDWAHKAYDNIENLKLTQVSSSADYFIESKKDDTRDKWNNGHKINDLNCPITFAKQIEATAKTPTAEKFVPVTAKIVGLTRKTPYRDWTFTSSKTDAERKDGEITHHEKTVNFKQYEEDYTVTVTYKGIEGSKTVTIPKIGDVPVENNDDDAEVKSLACKLEKVDVLDDSGKKVENQIEVKLIWPEVANLKTDGLIPLWEGADALENEPLNARVTLSEAEQLISAQTQVEIEGKKIEIKCSISVDPQGNIEPKNDDNDKDKGDYSISVSIEKDEAKKAIVKAIVTKGDKEVTSLSSESLTIVWISVTESTTKQEDDGVSSGSSTNTKQLKSGTDLTVDVDKIEKDQTIKATLKKEGMQDKDASAVVGKLSKDDKKDDSKKDRKPIGDGKMEQFTPQNFLPTTSGGFRGQN
jgi:hypothetical protein